MGKMLAWIILFVVGCCAEYQDADGFLKAHNIIRRFEYAANMKEMKWDEDLASLAEGWAKACVRGHNQNRETREFKKVGENIYRNTRRKSGFDAVVSWFKEKSSYNLMEGSCSGVCGHYTQVVWADSEYLGCAVAFCPKFFRGRGGYNYVCNYGPRGNWRGKKPYVPGIPCSSCPLGYGCPRGVCAKES
eukprot:XP_011427504.1 PREDICTED: peptidase inhibitor 16 [Crassostrea gigas]